MTSTENAEGSSPLLKADTVGRVLTPPARREQLLDEFERSGLSGARFAALVGIKYQTFAQWRIQRRNRTGPKSSEHSASGVRWLEAVVEQAQAPTEKTAAILRVRLSHGAQLEITHPTQIPLAAALLGALEKPNIPC